MTLWLWEAPGPACSARGVSRDRSRARQAALACLITGQAATALVWQAELIDGADVLAPRYQRTGERWQARRNRAGAIRWHPA